MPPKSAPARAGEARKAVTIDLEATDVTQKADTGATQEPTEKKPAASNDPHAAKGAAAPEIPVSSPKVDDKTAASKAPENTPKTDAAAKSNAGETIDDARKSAPALSAQTPQTSGSFVRAAVAAFVGGLIALSAYLGLQGAGVISEIGGNADQSGRAALEQRLAVLENLPAPETINPADLEHLATHLAAIEANVDAASADEEARARLDSLEARLADIEMRNAPASPPSPSDDAPDANDAERTPSGQAALLDRLSILETRLTAFEGTVQAFQSDAFDARITALDEKLRTLSAAVEGTANQSSIDGIKVTMDGFSKEFEALQSSLQELNVKGGVVDSTLASLAAKLEATQKALSDQDRARDAIYEIAQSVALDTFKQAARSGAPFADALDALKKTGFASEKLTLVAPYADKGLPDGDNLERDLERLLATASARTTNEATDSDAPQSAFDKLLSNARAAIKIRKIEDLSKTPDTPLGAMRAAFKQGDTEMFTAAMNKLDDNQKQLFSDWLSHWKAVSSLSTLGIAQPQDGRADAPSKEPPAPGNSAQ